MPSKPRQSLPLLLQHEGTLYSKGHHQIAGVDEAGRGCLAGPVFAAAVIFPPGVLIEGVNDSKKLTAARREFLYPLICEKSIAWSVARVEAPEIDQLNIHHASLRAMQMAVQSLDPAPGYVLIDGKFTLKGIGLPQEAVIGGDGRCHAIAAASILAKVSRDRWMIEASRIFQGFSFARHKGYGTRAHYDEIHSQGITLLHRKSFLKSLQKPFHS